MNIDQVMTIYRAAVDPTATAAEGLDWWREVRAEVMAVIEAPTKAAAAAVIAWWRSEYEWAVVGIRQYAPLAAFARWRRLF